MSLVQTCVCRHFPVKSQLFRPNMSCYRLITSRPRDETVTGESVSSKALIVFKNNFSFKLREPKGMTGRVLLCPIIPSWNICNSGSVTNHHALR